MQGIHILNEGMIEGIGLGIPYITMLLFIFGVVMLIMAILELLIDKKVVLGFFISSPVLLLISYIMLLTNAYKSVDDVYTYTVTIDENVSFVEFDSKYEVIDKEGRLYIITERNKNKNE